MIRPIEILLVDDNETDVLIARHALKATKMANSLSVVDNGTDAIRFLRRTPPFEAAPVPDIVLLDLNLPGKSGQEVLAEIKADTELRRIPITILTTSQNEEDVLKAYGHHANSYIAKPLDFATFESMLLAFEHYWLSIVKLPTRAM